MILSSNIANSNHLAQVAKAWINGSSSLQLASVSFRRGELEFLGFGQQICCFDVNQSVERAGVGALDDLCLLF